MEKIDILGIGLVEHDYNFSIIKNNKLFHYQEERYSRVKHSNYKDKNKKIEFFNKFFKISSNLKIVNFGYYNNKYCNICNYYKPRNLWQYLKLNENIYYLDHHQLHAFTAFLQSNFNESDILIWDGRGERFTTIFFNKNGDLIDLKSKIGQFWNILGNYSILGEFSESKIMGLSAFGEPKKKYIDLFYKYEFVDYEKIDSILYNDFINKIQEELNNFDKLKDLSASLQYYTNIRFLEMIEKVKTSKNLCISGGGAYNGYLNTLFYNLYKNVYVPPQPGDEGLSVGAALYGYYLKYKKRLKVKFEYLGNEYPLLEKENEEEKIEKIVNNLINNKIVGIFQGKAESGFRALGNRSILANPFYKENKDIINHKIKFREDFRPFAPVILNEDKNKYFDGNFDSPYMSFIVKCKIPQKIPAVIHIDNTSRIQTLKKEQNEILYKILKKFKEKTGYGVLLNTSFNSQEPIVNSPKHLKKYENLLKIYRF